MLERVARAVLLYSCFALGAGWIIYIVATLWGRPEVIAFDGSLNYWMTAIVIHGLALILTFDGDSLAYLLKYVFTSELEPAEWKPVVVPTRPRILAARFVILLSVIHVLVWASLYFSGPSEGRIVGLLSSAFLCNGIYMVCHWALRPQNIFSEALVHFLRHPYAWFSVPAYRMVKSLPLAFEDWLQQVGEICKQLVDGAAAGQLPDSLELQLDVLDELESKTYLMQHRRRLTKPGREAIDRFVRSVEALKTDSDNQADWDTVIHAAKQVVDIRSELAW